MPMFPKPKSSLRGGGALDLDTAQAIATDALLFLTSEPQRLTGFLSTSGVSPQDLAARAETTEFLAFVLDHVLSEESLLLAFSANAQIKPEKVAAAALALGGQPPHWSA